MRADPLRMALAPPFSTLWLCELYFPTLQKEQDAERFSC